MLFDFLVRGLLVLFLFFFNRFVFFSDIFNKFDDGFIVKVENAVFNHLFLLEVVVVSQERAQQFFNTVLYDHLLQYFTNDQLCQKFDVAHDFLLYVFQVEFFVFWSLEVREELKFFIKEVLNFFNQKKLERVFFVFVPCFEFEINWVFLGKILTKFSISARVFWLAPCFVDDLLNQNFADLFILIEVGKNVFFHKLKIFRDDQIEVVNYLNSILLKFSLALSLFYHLFFIVFGFLFDVIPHDPRLDGLFSSDDQLNLRVFLGFVAQVFSSFNVLLLSTSHVEVGVFSFLPLAAFLLIPAGRLFSEFDFNFLTFPSFNFLNLCYNFRVSQFLKVLFRVAIDEFFDFRDGEFGGFWFGFGRRRRGLFLFDLRFFVFLVLSFLIVSSFSFLPMFVLAVFFVLSPLVVVLVSAIISFSAILGCFLVILIASKLFRRVVLRLVVLIGLLLIVIGLLLVVLWLTIGLLIVGLSFWGWGISRIVLRVVCLDVLIVLSSSFFIDPLQLFIDPLDFLAVLCPQFLKLLPVLGLVVNPTAIGVLHGDAFQELV